MQPSTLPSSDSDIWKQAYLQQIDEGTLQNAKEIIRNELDKSDKHKYKNLKIHVKIRTTHLF